ncbi:GNAT family N-acetyltransferase [Pseudoalteromonas sp. MMG010]|uniref:GNAT family N-acetyltransferase n=1 Tax=Pseudoalteromonas sp. MMG010 TaxID=2822685 RepID=UPI001B3A48EB|nr:GNAT family N-acetyltransferase [Pseudoalteromonas sp. MMG010]MBQ4832483.1 GNAT family N-acetyltransferase [Pseudoalteromonas sp. MMG010]
MDYCVKQVNWHTCENILRQIREKVFVYELHIPKTVEFDHKDNHAHHVLVSDKLNKPIATGRLCADGLLGRVAVLPDYRIPEVYQPLLNQLVSIAKQNGLKEISINCILQEVKKFTDSGFNPNGNVFMEAGIARQKLQCPISHFQTTPFTLVH